MGSPMKLVCDELIRELNHTVLNLENTAKKLEADTAERFAKAGVNPVALLRRIKKLEGELPALTEECQTLIRSKQEVVDGAKQQLVHNRQQLHQLCSKSGLQVDEQDQAFNSFTQAVAQWDNQAAAYSTGDASNCLSRAELNRVLAKTSMMH